jgi:hypothetical protein
MRKASLILSVLFLVSGVLSGASPTTVTQTQSTTPTSGKPTPIEQLSYQNAVKFFRESLKERPLKVHQRCAVFFEGEYTSSNIYSHSVIIIENSDEDLEITFYISDDRGMFWISEFIDSAFFTRRETQSLFQLLHQTSGDRTARVGRFWVELTRAEPHHAKIVVFSFTPARPRR